MIVARKKSSYSFEVIGFADDFDGWLNEHLGNGRCDDFAEVKVLRVVDETKYYDVRSLTQR